MRTLTLAALLLVVGGAAAPAPLGAAGAADVTVSSAGARTTQEVQLDGLYVGTLVYYTLAQTNLRTLYYVFSPGGRVYHGLPKGGYPGGFDFARAEREDPEHCGRYQVIGGRIRFVWEGDAEPQTVSFQRGGQGGADLEIDGTAFHRVRSADGLRLNGEYTHSASAGVREHEPGPGEVTTERSIRFDREGRFSAQGAVGAADEAYTAGVITRSSGTYRISGNTLEFAYSDGRRERFTFFVDPESEGREPPGLIVIDGQKLVASGAEPQPAGRAVAPVPESTSGAPSAADAARGAAEAGKALGDAGRWTEAERQYREAVRLAPAVAEYHGRLAYTLLAQGRGDEALAESREALRLGPAESWMHYFAGLALVQRERVGEAEAEFRAAVRLTPRIAEYHANLGYALFVQGRYAESLAESQGALRINPSLAMAHDNAGDALQHLGRVSDGEVEFRAAIRLEPRMAVFHFDLAGLLLGQGRRDEAIPEAREAVRLDPANQQYQALLQKAQHGGP